MTGKTMVNRRDFLKGFLAATAVTALAPLPQLAELPTKQATFEDMVALTLKNYRQMLTDNITSKSVIFTKFQELGWIPPEGMKLIEPIGR